MMFGATKDPQAKLDYAIDWSLWLSELDTITISTWTVTNGLVASGATIDEAGRVTTVWLSGGNLGACSATNHVKTATGREDDRTIIVSVEQR